MSPNEQSLYTQTFENIIQDNHIYADKTDLVYKLAHAGKFIVFHRPRGFGKSLLVSTLQAYFEGEDTLFKGLKIADIEKDWKKHPVLRFDLNNGNFKRRKGLVKHLESQLELYEEKYEITNRSKSLVTRFGNLIIKASKQTGQKVVILIDNYARPILEGINNPKLMQCHRAQIKPFYCTLKSFEEHIKFAMLTSDTPLGELNFYSDLNFFQNLSLDPEFATLGGFTEQEMKDYFSPFIFNLSKRMNWDKERTITELRKRYGGYRFSSEDIMVYNPYSLLHCFESNMLEDYRFTKESSKLLHHILSYCEFDLAKLEGLEVTEGTLNSIDDEFSSPIPLLYQNG